MVQEHGTPKINQPTALSWQQVRALPPVQGSPKILEQKSGRSPPTGSHSSSRHPAFFRPGPLLDLLNLVYAYGKYPGVHDDHFIYFTVHHLRNESRVRSVKWYSPYLEIWHCEQKQDANRVLTRYLFLTFLTTASSSPDAGFSASTSLQHLLSVITLTVVVAASFFGVFAPIKWYVSRVPSIPASFEPGRR